MKDFQDLHKLFAELLKANLTSKGDDWFDHYYSSSKFSKVIKSVIEEYAKRMELILISEKSRILNGQKKQKYDYALGLNEGSNFKPIWYVEHENSHDTWRKEELEGKFLRGDNRINKVLISYYKYNEESIEDAKRKTKMSIEYYSNEKHNILFIFGPGWKTSFKHNVSDIKNCDFKAFYYDHELRKIIDLEYLPILKDLP